MDARDGVRGGPERLAESFVEMVDTLVGEFDVHELLLVLANRCVDVLDVAATGLLLADAGGDLRVMVTSDERVQLLELYQLQHDEGPCVECYRSGEGVAVEDLGRARRRWPRLAPVALDHGFRSVIAVPMRVRGQVLGAVNLFGTSDRPAGGTATMRIAQAMTDVAAIAIVQDRQTRERMTLVEQLQTALESRLAIEQAKGVLSSRLGITPDEAFVLLRQRARSSRRLLLDVAGEAINTGGMDYTARGR